MAIRTDLALERKEILNKNIDGIDYTEDYKDDMKITRININDSYAEEKFQKPKGKYITVELPRFTADYKEPIERVDVISDEIEELLPDEGLVLVAGLGNSNITPDNLGPLTASNVIATRHIQGEIAKSIGIDGLRPVAVIIPGVLGQTGIDTAEILKGITTKLKPSAILIIDALASRKLERLGCTIQISDSGISPGSGVNNARPEISKKTIGVPVISLGIPTVVDSVTLVADMMGSSRQDIKRSRYLQEKNMMVTPREIDLLIERASKLAAMSINCALQPNFSIEELSSLM